MIVPPNCGHVTINPSEGLLKMANGVCFRSIRSTILTQKLRGAAYYELINGRLLHTECIINNMPEIRVA